MTALYHIPPSYWLQAWQIDCDTLFDAALQENEILQSFTLHWFRAALRSGDAKCAEAAFYRISDGRYVKEWHYVDLYRLLSVDAYMRLIDDTIEHFQDKYAFLLDRLIRHCPIVITSESYSPSFLKYLASLVPNGASYGHGSISFRCFRKHITPRYENEYLELLEQFLTRYKRRKDKQVTLEEHHQFFDYRQQIHDAFNNL